MIINEVLYISGAFLLSLKKDPEFAPDNFLLSLKKDPEFAPDKLRRNAIFCFRPETKKALILL